MFVILNLPGWCGLVAWWYMSWRYQRATTGCDRRCGLLLNPSLLQRTKTAKPENGSEIVLITGRGWVVSCRQLMLLGMRCGRCCSMGPSASLAVQKSWNEGRDDSGDNDNG